MHSCGRMVDLNSFVPTGSNLTLTEATLINDRGEIAAQGVFPNGDTHAILLIPCDKEHGDREGCEDESAGAGVVRQAPASSAVSGMSLHLPMWRRRGRFDASQTAAGHRNLRLWEPSQTDELAVKLEQDCGRAD